MMNNTISKLPNLAVFTGRYNQILTKKICKYIGVDISRSKVELFPDGEIGLKIEEDIRGKDCFVILSTCPPVNDNIMELFIYLDCLRRSSAKRITAVIPYFGYARQDRKVEGRTPITAKLIADILSIKADRVLVMDLHAQQIEGFFDIPVDHLRARTVIVNYFRKRNIEDIVVLSPDTGNMKVANAYAQDLNVDFALIDKRRISGEEVIPIRIVGNVENKEVLMFDDMISTAGTVCSAASIAIDKGAVSVTAVATHGLFCGTAFEKLVRSDIEEVVVTDTIPLGTEMKTLIDGNNGPLEKNIKLKILSVSELLGEAIIRIHQDKSVSLLLKPNYKENKKKW